MSPDAREKDARPLVIEGAHKRYGARVALEGLELAVEAGSWIALVGPNGAGKTTTMRLATGLLRADEGHVLRFGDPVEAPDPRRVGFVPQDIALWSSLSARENLRAFARLHGLSGREADERVAWALSWTGLEARADERVERFSGGMKRRLNIACGVLHRPRLVLLDEPTVGVDPHARGRIVAMLRGLVDEGVSVVQSTHELGDVEEHAERVVVMDRGRVLASGGLDELVAERLGPGARVLVETERALSTSGWPEGLEALGGRLEGRVADAAGLLPALLERATREGGRLARVEVERPGLAELFTALTGRDLRE